MSATATFVNCHFVAYLTREQAEQLLSDVVSDYEQQRRELLAPLRGFAYQRSSIA